MTTPTDPTQPANFAVLTLDVQTVTNDPVTGETLANAVLSAAVLSVTPAGKDALPVQVRTRNGIAKWLKAGKPVTLQGRLRYEQAEGETGRLVLLPSKAIKTGPQDRPRNFAKLTLQMGQDPHAAYSPNGVFWVRARMFLGQGKDEAGDWLPSLWLTVKAFAHDGDETLPAALAALSKGDRATLNLRLGYELYQEKGYLTATAMKIEPWDAGSPEPDELPEDQALEGEPV